MQNASAKVGSRCIADTHPCDAGDGTRAKQSSATLQGSATDWRSMFVQLWGKSDLHTLATTARSQSSPSPMARFATPMSPVALGLA